MGSLALPFENLPLGFRFKPTDVELIDHYLRLKINGKDEEVACITEVDICRVEPWDLPDLSAIKTNDHEWFFFCPRDRKYPNGQRSNRATGAGYWKATGKDRTIKSRKMGLIGMKKTLVFYTGRAPKGQRTHWVIHEYRTTLQELDGTNPGQGAFVLCRLFKKADEQRHEDNDDCSNTEEVETVTASPVANSMEDMSSGPAVVQASPDVLPTVVEQPIRIVKTSDSMTSETVLPDHSSHSNSYHLPAGESKLNEEVTQVESHRNEPMGNFFDSSNPFGLPPIHGNPGSLDMAHYFNLEIGDDHNGLLFQDVYAGETINEFLNSAIIDPDEYLGGETISQGAQFVGSDNMWNNTDVPYWKNISAKESGSCSGSDVEVAQVQHDVGFINCITSEKYYNEVRGNGQPVQAQVFDDDDIFSDEHLSRFCYPNDGEQKEAVHDTLVKAEDVNFNNGPAIRIRSRRALPQPTNFKPPQGVANRRIYLSMNEVQKAESQETVTEGSCLLEEYGSTVSPEEYFCPDELFGKTAAEERESCMDDGEPVETGITIRTRLHKSQPSASTVGAQGIAPRRLRFKMQYKEQMSAAKDDESHDVDSGVTDEGVCLLSKSGEGVVDGASSTVSSEKVFCPDEIIRKTPAPEEKEQSVDGGADFGTGIKVRARFRKSQTRASGLTGLTAELAARRRVRSGPVKLLHVQNSEAKDNEANQKIAETRSLSEDDSDKVCASKSDDEADKKSIPSKGSMSELSVAVGRYPVSHAFMLKLVLVVFLFMAFIGVWNARHIISLAS